MRRRFLLGLAGLCLAAAGLAPLSAQDAKVSAEVPGTFRSFIVVDDRFAPRKTPVVVPEDRDPRDRTGKMHCVVCEFGLNPAVLVLTRANPAEGSPVAKLAQKLDATLQSRDAKAKSVNGAVIFLTLNSEYPTDIARNAAGEFLREGKSKSVRDLATQLKTPKLVYGLAARNSPEAVAWGLADADETEVVVYDRMKPVKKWNFAEGGPTDADIDAIDAAVKALAK
jgi:hypothetical protein